MEVDNTKQITDGYHKGEVINEGPFGINVGDVLGTADEKTALDEAQTLALLEQQNYEKVLKMWLALPMRIRPLEFVPGRTRGRRFTATRFTAGLFY